MGSLQVNCLVCEQELVPVWHQNELTYQCRGTTWCEAIPIDGPQAAALAAIQQRLAALEDLETVTLTYGEVLLSSTEVPYKAWRPACDIFLEDIREWLQKQKETEQ